MRIAEESPLAHLQMMEQRFQLHNPCGFGIAEFRKRTLEQRVRQLALLIGHLLNLQALAIVHGNEVPVEPLRSVVGEQRHFALFGIKRREKTCRGGSHIDSGRVGLEIAPGGRNREDAHQQGNNDQTRFHSERLPAKYARFVATYRGPMPANRTTPSPACPWLAGGKCRYCFAARSRECRARDRSWRPVPRGESVCSWGTRRTC